MWNSENDKILIVTLGEHVSNFLGISAWLLKFEMRCILHDYLIHFDANWCIDTSAITTQNIFEFVKQSSIFQPMFASFHKLACLLFDTVTDFIRSLKKRYNRRLLGPYDQIHGSDKSIVKSYSTPLPIIWSYVEFVILRNRSNICRLVIYPPQ